MFHLVTLINFRQMKTTKICLTYVTCFVLTLFAAMSSPHEGLDKKVDSLLLAHYGAEGPGGAIAVISGEGVVLKRCFGMMNLEKNRKVDEHTLFDIASVAKQFTSFAILMLEQQGQLDLDVDIRRYIPELPSYEHEVTIRHLMHHTSGVPSTDVLRLLGGLKLDETWTQQEEIEILRSYPHLNFPPNSEYLYSNGGYSLLASIIERVTDQKFDDFMQQQVFAPMKMNSAMVLTELPSDSSLFAVGYKKEENGYSPFSSMNDFSYGGGNIYASIDDMIQWSGSILNPTLYNPAFFDRIQKPQHILENGDTITYTNGFFARTYKGLPMTDHSGGVPGFRSLLMYFPSEQIIIVYLGNLENNSFRSLSNAIAEMMFGEKFVEKPVAPRIAVEFDVEEVKRFEGNYRLPDGMELAFQLDKDTFWVVVPGGERYQLFAESENHFFLKAFDAQCTFIVSNDGNADEMIWHQRGSDNEARRVTGTVPFMEDEKVFLSGTYKPQGLDAQYRIVYEDDMLTLYLPDTFSKYLGFGESEMSHINGDSFYLQWLGLIELTRDGNGHIDGFVLLNLGRIRNVPFSKI